ncbi:MAG TPA: sigma 54-interacting transcriptional regulator [Candidatus Bathyarchaeia archaeon]|nr:sigma 54-interacting transcriptional regulator [Candidatus Bathyarchaeia archaeon]
MDSRVVVISGPSKGTVVRLKGDHLSVGRDPTNHLSLRGDRAVSRKHFTISKTDVAFHLVDLNSHNGTFVNGIPVRRKLLSHGDTIRVGLCELVFLITGDEEQVQEDVQFRETQPGDALSTTNVRAYRSTPQSGTDVGRMARDLNALFKIANTINSIRELGPLQHRLLELVGEVVPADSAAVVMLRHGDDDPTSSSVWHRRAGGQAISIRRELVQRVLWERNPLLIDAGNGNSQSVLCVPLVGVERAIGVLYLTTGNKHKFEDDHVHFLTSVAGIAAVTLENVLATEALRSENRRLQAELDLEGVIIGESKGMRGVQNFIGRVARSDSTVLIRGESGTGKELVARAIHRNSTRADRPFVAINCAAIPEALLESELFGHEKGSFTGAIAMKKGKLEVAEAGTIFLDEIGELAPPLQAKLLRALQEHEFERLGGTRPLKMNARVIAATNKNLEEAIKAGQFRQDLYYRLNVVSVVVPPLRERPDDIALLAMYFAAKYSEKCNRSLKGISTEARALLLNYCWPGNVRELENAIERAIVLGIGDEIVPDDLPDVLLEVQPAKPSGAQYHDRINDLKKGMIVEAVKQAKGNYTEAAKQLGVHPNYLHRLIRNLNIRSEVKKESEE